MCTILKTCRCECICKKDCTNLGLSGGVWDDFYDFDIFSIEIQAKCRECPCEFFMNLAYAL